MANPIGSLRAELSATAARFEQDMGRARKSVSDFGSNVKGIFKALVPVISATTIIGFTKSVVSAAKEAEDEQIALRRQVEAAGISWSEYGDIINDTVQKTSRYAAVQDEEVSRALRGLILISNDVAASQKNLNLVFDLAAAKGIDVQTATDLVGKAMSGNVEILGRYIPEVREVVNQLGNNATNAQKAEAVMGLLHERVNGSAASMSDLSRASMELNIQLDELKKTMGKELLPILSKIIKAELEGIEGLKLFLGIGLTPQDQLIKQMILREDILHRLNKQLEDTKTGFMGIFPGAEGRREDRLTNISNQIKGIEQELKGLDIAYAALGKRQVEALSKPLPKVTTSLDLEADQKAIDQAIKNENHLFLARVENAKAANQAIGLAQEAMGQQILSKNKELVEAQKLLGVEMANTHQEAAIKAADIWQTWFGQINSTMEQMQSLSKNTWTAFSTQFSQAIANAIVFGESFGEAFKNIMTNVVSSFIAGMIQMGLQRIITALIFQGQNVAESTSRMSALAAQTFAGAFAATASIPVIGPALAPKIATASVVAMLAGATIAGKAGSAVGAGVAAFGEGGLVTAPTLALIGESGPEAIIPLDRMNGLRKTQNDVRIEIILDSHILTKALVPNIPGYVRIRTGLARG